MKNRLDTIYIQPNAHDRWFEGNKPNNNFVEYIRKDTFIEKALKFLDEYFFFNNRRYIIESEVFDSKKEMIEDFKKYIED